MNEVKRRPYDENGDYGISDQARHTVALAHPAPRLDSPSSSGHQSESSNHKVRISRNKVRKSSIVILIVIFTCIVCCYAYFYHHKNNVSRFPSDITASLSYPVYYSNNTTHGYSFQPGSAKIKAGILFYTTANHSKKVFITEQNAPSTQINLSSLPKYTSLQVPIGQAVIGTGLGNPSVVIITPATLIELTSSKGVTKSDVIGVAQKLALQN